MYSALEDVDVVVLHFWIDERLPVRSFNPRTREVVSTRTTAFPLTDERWPVAEPDRRLHPNLWWPADHAWCVATDVDMMTTYVGGSAETVAAVLADTGLEAHPVTADDAVTWDSDTVNRTTG